MNVTEVDPARPRRLTGPRAEGPPPPPALRPLASLDVERIRVSAERPLAAAVEAHPLFRQIVSRLRLPDPKDERRRLMAHSLRLSDSMAPEAHRIAREAQRVLGIDGALELYQRSGPENAAMHFVEAPILLEIQGGLLARLDPGAVLALFGHELGHYLAHGPRSPYRAALALPPGVVDDEELAAALSRLSMMRELTADRISLLACQDLAAVLRLMLVSVSGLSIGELNSDTEAYLAQCRELIEADLGAGATASGETHPEHGLRVYAAWLFSETRIYRELTGQGPGTRELAEVDATLARCLGADRRPVHDPVQAGDVPREFLECALAAAVIVAHADGQITEEEQALLERVFAAEIDDWQSYLAFDVALDRFVAAATIIAPSAREFGPALLQLLFDVMIADREVHPRELAMILEIGRVLGVGAQFARALTVIVRQRGHEIDLSTLAPPEQPLPARRQDVDEALRTFVGGVLRRGESTTTLRRLLRLVGLDRRDDAAVAKLEAAFADHRVAITPPLDEVGLDDRLVLVPPAQAAAKPAPTVLTGSRAALVAALRRLREQLVSGDGRSPSVRLRALRRGRAFDLMALDRVSVGMAERVLEQVRARRAVRVLDAADAGRHGPASVAAAELVALAREDAQCTEETGARDLYVGYPFLTGCAAGYVVRAPLVLYPVELVRDGDGARGFRLDPRRDEPPIVNQSLLRLVFNKRGFAWTDELSDELENLAADPDLGPEAVVRRLADVGLAAEMATTPLEPVGELDDEALASAGERLALHEHAVLGLFPQSSSDLLQDYDGLLHDLARPDADVSSLLGAACTLLPSALATAPDAGAGQVEADWAPVIQADPSQRSVIAEARRHGATVVDGPPGTGKSQVIVNLVAEALRRGERVAVVCEKRAALDVVHQRMAAIGFGKALAVVHDVHEDRKALYAHVAGRLEATGRVPFDAREAEATRAEHARVAASLAQRAALLARRPAGLDLSVGELLTYVTRDADVPALPGGEHLAGVTRADLRTLLDLTAALRPLAEVWGPAGRWRGPAGAGPRRPSLASGAATQVRDLDAQLVRAIAAAHELARQRSSNPADVSLEAVDGARAALATAVASRAGRGDARDLPTFTALARLAASEPERLREAGRARQAWQQGKDAMLRLKQPVAFDATPSLTAALSVVTRWVGVWYRFFVLGWWQARGRFRAELARAWPERAGAPLTGALVAEVADRIAAGRAWSAIRAGYVRLGIGDALPDSAVEVGPRLDRLTGLAEQIGELGAARDALVRAAAWLPEDVTSAAGVMAWDGAVDQRAALLAASDALGAAVEPIRRWFPWLTSRPGPGELEALLGAWRREGARLVEADALLDQAEAIVPSARSIFDGAAVAWTALPVERWRSGLSSAWALAWLARLEREEPALNALGSGADDRERERLAGRLRQLETERCELEIERTLARLDEAELLKVEAAAKSQRRTPAQKVREELLKEARKKRMLMPLRTFVRRFAPAGLLDVAPVWLLSPETMAILFPRQALFDLVVFDEASQCTVEAGLPVLLRARRVVIAGDEKQMPPSSYFALGAGDDEEDLGGTVEADERHDAIRDLLTAESLLSLARPRVARAGLAWHYRCRDEALIAFSNHAMYEGGLLTIPSTAGATAASALHWVSVQDGSYDAGENLPEARRVVDLVDELLGRDPAPTVGVVTFNLKQRKAVLDAIDARCASDAGFRERWTSASTGALDERPFVKNLEQVQGDERDVIVFSLGHAPQVRHRKGIATGETYVPARFGPLGQRGGERRLNVAISRAKAACYVVASFSPAQLTVASSKHQGPRLFKHFLEFAHLQHSGRRLEASRVLDLVRGATRADAVARSRLPLEDFVPLKTQVALALEAAGVPYESDVGSSGFRVPLAVLDPAEPTRYALALLLDDGADSPDPFDLHVHRPGVLGQRGWKTFSINAASWYRRPAEIVAEIEALVPGCRGAIHSELYQRHRARLASQSTEAALAVTARRPRSTSQTPYFGGPGVASEAEPAAAAATAAAASLPAWSLAIPDELFRAALLYLERHGLLNEAELMSMVGGPRRARQFARDLDGWRADLPFGVDIDVSAGAAVYRKVTQA